MTNLLGTVSVFTVFVISVWLGDIGIYLPLTVWMIFAAGNFYGVKNAILPAFLTATFAGLTYDRGAAGFIEPFVPFIFWFLASLCDKKYVYGTVSSWFPGLCTGMMAAFILYGSRILSGGWRYGGEWLSFCVNVFFSGMIGIFILPLLMWFLAVVSGKIGIEIRKTGQIQ